MSAAVPSSRRITGGLLKGYFIRTSSSYPAYPREFPAGVRKSFCCSPFAPLDRFCGRSAEYVSPYSAENSRRRETRARDTSRSNDSPKMRARRKNRIFYDAFYYDVLRNENPFPATFIFACNQARS